jgi:phosphotransferase family enzyme
VEQQTLKVESVDLRAHPAVCAWAQLDSGRMFPSAIEILKHRAKSQVYRLAGVGINGSAVIAKHCRAESAAVEQIIYQEVLPHFPLTRLHYYGHVALPGEEYRWIFVQEASGSPYNPEHKQHVRSAARWLGHLHRVGPQLPQVGHLPARDANYYLCVLKSAREGLFDGRRYVDEMDSDVVVLIGDLISWLDELESDWDRLLEICGETPRTVVHGDFCARKNLRVFEQGEGVVVLPFDWETGGWGGPAADLWHFADRCADPNGARDIYGAIVRECWPRVGPRKIERMANLGRVFRLVQSLQWACEGVRCQPGAAAFARMLGQLRSYHRIIRGSNSIMWAEV